MQIIRKLSLFAFVGLTFWSLIDAEDASPFPQLPEIVNAISRHLPHISESEIERAALQGILTEFQSQIELIAPPDASDSNETGIALNRFYESSIGYLAVPLMEKSAHASFKNGLLQLKADHDLGGLILDLRHVSGTHYEAVAEITGFFISREMPLLDWGEGIQNVKPQSITLEIPIIALIDETTIEAGEALAAAIRLSKLGLLIGRSTAGNAHRFEEVSLQSGQILRLTTGEIKMADGEMLGKKPVSPDIHISSTVLLSHDSHNDLSQNSPHDSHNDHNDLFENSPENSPHNLVNQKDRNDDSLDDDVILKRACELLKAIGIVEKRNRPE